MNDSQKYIRAVSLPSVAAVKTNAPPQYKDRKRQYMADRRMLYDEQRDYLATDYVTARVQGLDPNDFFKWTETQIRLSDVSTQSVTAFDSKMYDNFKEILFRSRAIDYIPPGAYVETMGSVWMVVNPGNMSSATTNAVIARCRAAFNFYDDYGNICSEPLVIDRATMLSNRVESPENLVLPEGYFNVKCQKNANTMRHLEDNKRIILGRKAYYITGFTDFFEEFTGDFDSAHVLTFTVRREEPEEHDDLVNRIADGLYYSWSAEITGAEPIPPGGSKQLTAHMILNGSDVPQSDEVPQTWTWSSSNENVATVSSEGLVNALSEGDTVITATLEQNPALTAQTGIAVMEIGEVIRFVGVIPPTLTQYASMTLTAVDEVGGEEQDVPLEWEFSGAAKGDYGAVVSDDTKSCVVTCYSASEKPLVVTVRHGNAEMAKKIILEGY